MYQNIPTLSRSQRLYYSFTLPSFENCIYSHQSIASFLACAFMYAYPNRHIVIGIIAYGSLVGLVLDIRALSSKQHLGSETLKQGNLLLSWFLVPSNLGIRSSTYLKISQSIRLLSTSFLEVASFRFKAGHAASLSNPQTLQSM